MVLDPLFGLSGKLASWPRIEAWRVIGWHPKIGWCASWLDTVPCIGNPSDRNLNPDAEMLWSLFNTTRLRNNQTAWVSRRCRDWGDRRENSIIKGIKSQTNLQ